MNSIMHTLIRTDRGVCSLVCSTRENAMRTLLMKRCLGDSRQNQIRVRSFPLGLCWALCPSNLSHKFWVNTTTKSRTSQSISHLKQQHQLGRDRWDGTALEVLLNDNELDIISLLDYWLDQGSEPGLFDIALMIYEEWSMACSESANVIRGYIFREGRHSHGTPDSLLHSSPYRQVKQICFQIIISAHSDLIKPLAQSSLEQIVPMSFVQVCLS